jgi:hypothetical protein
LRRGLFQVASQFNLLEMVSFSVTPEQGVTGYESHHTQGPAGAVTYVTLPSTSPAHAAMSFDMKLAQGQSSEAHSTSKCGSRTFARDMGPEVEAFFTMLANDRRASASIHK